MNRSLDHLPAKKREELAFVVEVICAGFAEAISRRSQDRFRQGRVLKIILFGSYARGDWVEDPKGRYFSDYDLLVVVNHPDLTDPAEFWDKTEQTLSAELASGEKLKTQPSLIYHDLEDVNAQLRLGRYFFLDVLKDGIVLFEEPGHAFARPMPLEPNAALAEVKGFYGEWFESASRFFENARDDVRRGWAKEAAFLLHQSAERLYHAALLTLSLYSPKTHRLNRLREQAEDLDARLRSVWPRDNKFQRRCFELLKRAYVDARYSPHYTIKPDELAFIDERVGVLQQVVRTVCEERIAELAAAAQAAE